MSYSHVPPDGTAGGRAGDSSGRALAPPPSSLPPPSTSEAPCGANSHQRRCAGFASATESWFIGWRTRNASVSGWAAWTAPVRVFWKPSAMRFHGSGIGAAANSTAAQSLHRSWLGWSAVGARQESLRASARRRSPDGCSGSAPPSPPAAAPPPPLAAAPGCARQSRALASPTCPGSTLAWRAVASATDRSRILRFRRMVSRYTSRR